MNEQMKNLEIGNSGKSLPNEIERLSEKDENKTVRIRGFLNTLRITRYVAFIVLRDKLSTIQCIVELESSEENAEKAKKLNVESFVEITGKVKVAKKPISGCTQKNIEIEVLGINVLGDVISPLPFSLKDASATEEERATNKSICSVAYNLCIDNRFLDFRMPQTQAIIRVLDGVMFMYREYLRAHGFIEIKTTKIIQSGSEGGAELIKIDFFGSPAFLAQSAQLYKQMAIIGGLKRVFEVGHVYRAEVSNINRYLSEFTVLDIEMEMESGYMEVIQFIHRMFVHIFDGLKKNHSELLETIRRYRHFEDLKYKNEPVIVTHRKAIDLLKSRGVSIDYKDDFNRESEKILGGIVKELYGVDIFVVTEYPADVRAFYTYVEPETGTSHSFDFIMRGEEILSGSQRISNYENLKNAIISRDIKPESLNFYLEPFKFGAPPHAGCGVGLERLLKSYFNCDDIRHFALFPRDPDRLTP